MTGSKTTDKKLGHENEIDFQKTGTRFRHLLDAIGFKEGRGRINDFQEFLQKNLPDVFGDVPYTTVRSWFKDHSPPMKKVELIVETLDKEYSIDYDLQKIKLWWKTGGSYPFTNECRKDFNDTADDYYEKQKLKIISLVHDECGSLFDDLSTEELVKIIEKINNFAEMFADPNVTNCPSSVFRLLIRDQIRTINE